MPAGGRITALANAILAPHIRAFSLKQRSRASITAPVPYGHDVSPPAILELGLKKTAKQARDVQSKFGSAYGGREINAAYNAFEQVLMELRKTYMTWQAMDTYWVRHFIISQLSDRQTKLFLPVAKDWVYTFQAMLSVIMTRLSVLGEHSLLQTLKKDLRRLEGSIELVKDYIHARIECETASADIDDKFKLLLSSIENAIATTEVRLWSSSKTGTHARQRSAARP